MAAKDGTIIKSCRELGLEGLRFQGLMQDFPKHFHDYYVIGLVRQGRRRLRVGDSERLLGAGDAVIFNPQEGHGCQAVDGEPLHYLGLHIDVRTMEKIAGRLYRYEIQPRFTGLPPALGAEFSSFHDLFMAANQPRSLAAAFGRFAEKLLNQAAVADEDEASDQRGLEAARLIMERKFAEPLSLEHLSSVAGMSKYHFLRAFSRRTGMSPHSYLLALRVARARKLLADGCRPSETALQTGFVDQSHFSNRFKTITGLTPDSYRRSGISSGPAAIDGSHGPDGRGFNK